MVNTTVRRIEALAACAGIMCIAASVGCAPRLTKRYALATGTFGDGTISVSGSAFPIDAAGPRTIFDLSAEGQAALVEATAAKLDDVSGLGAAIAAPVARSPGSGIQDLATLARRVVLTLETRHRSLADRLDACVVTLSVEEANPVRFKSWNQLTTKFETIDLGKVNSSQKATFSAGLEGSAPGSTEINKATLGVTGENTLSEEVVLRQRYVASSGALTDREAKVIQQGAVGIDLVGNIVFDLTVTTPQSRLERLYRVENLFGKGGSAQDPGLVRVTRRLVRVPTAIGGGWRTDLDAVCRRRDVTVGADTITESDDEVTFAESAATRRSVVLAAEDDLRVSKWVLSTATQRILHIQEPEGPTVLQFDSFDGARDFLVWLLASDAAAVAGRSLGFPVLGQPAGLDTPAAKGRWQGLSVRIAGANWSAEE